MVAAKGEIGANDGLVQKVLRAQGRMIGTHPVKWCSGFCLVYVIIIIIGFTSRKGFGGDKPIMDEEAFSVQWCVKGGTTEKHIKRNIKESDTTVKKAWASQYSTTMFMTKDVTVDKDSNVVTQASFMEMLEVHKLFFALNVTVNGKFYSSSDLCSRGMYPDYPGGALPIKQPCLIVGPLNCFKEAGDLSPVSYRSVDNLGLCGIPGHPNPAAKMPCLMLIKMMLSSTLPYSTRASLATMTDQQLKDKLSTKLPAPYTHTGEDGNDRGCTGYNSNYKFYADLWTGTAKWNNGSLSGSKGIRSLFYMDGSAKIQYRMNTTRPGETLVNLLAALEKQSKLWEQTVVAFNKRSKHIFISNLRDWAEHGEKDLNKEMQDFRGEFYLGGILLLLTFCACTLVKCSHPEASRGTIGYAGLSMVIITIVVSFGMCFLTDTPLNGPTVLAVPLLGMGLGLDDMFVFLRYFSGLGSEFIADNTEADIIGETMARAGPGAALTSMCNVCAFFCGIFLPVRAMSFFCVCAALIALFNFLTLANIFVPLLVWETRRIKKRGMDPIAFCCHMSLMKKAADGEDDILATSSEHFKTGIEKNLVRFIREKYAPFLCKPIPAILLSLFGVCLFIVAIMLITSAKIGYAPHELFPASNPHHWGMLHLFQTFSMFPQSLLFFDLDVAASQADLLRTFTAYTATKYGGASPNPPVFWMTYQVMMGATQAPCTAGVNASMMAAMAPLGMNWMQVAQHPLFKLNIYKCMAAQAKFMPAAPVGKQKLCGGNDTVSAAMGANMSLPCAYQHAGYAPFGVMHPLAFYPTLNMLRKIPQQPLTAASSPAFMYMDATGINDFSWDKGTSFDTAGSKITYGYIGAVQKNLINEDVFVEAIEQCKKVADNAPASVKDNIFLYGPILVFWEVFMDLEPELFKIMGIDCGIILVITFLAFGCDAVTAIITCISCTMIVLEIYGVSVSMMNFNVFVASFTLMAMGMSVEFTAHLAAAFSLGGGDAVDRLSDAMGHTFPALVEGSISTFCGIFPLAFHPQMFVVKYIFTIMAMIVVIGMINGAIIMPAMLALLAPLLKYTKCGGSKVAPQDVK